MPADFANTYRELSHETDQIVSIHLPAKVSGTYNSALQGREMSQTMASIKVVDSFAISMGLGLVVMTAARMAQAGGDLQQVMHETGKAIEQIRLLAILDSLKYLLAGGRITKARATVGSLLKVKPILTVREDGEIVQAGLARSYEKGMNQLYEFVRNIPSVQEVAIVQSTVSDEANTLRERIGDIVDKDLIHMARLGAGLGVHGGPGTLIVAVRAGINNSD
jgi:DegV family protein with EDD domain